MKPAQGQHLSSHWIVQIHGRTLLQCISPVRSEPDQEAAAKFQCAFKIKVCVESLSVQVRVHMCATGAHVCVYMSLWRSLLQLPLTEATSLNEPGAHPSFHLDKAAVPACLGSEPQPSHYTASTVPTEPGPQSLDVFFLMEAKRIKLFF